MIMSGKTTERETKPFYLIRNAEEVDFVVEAFFPPRLPDGDLHQHSGLVEPPSVGSDCLGYQANKRMFRDILTAILESTQEFSLVKEEYHVDPSFRDSYYNYFSNQHFSMSRFCQRITFFSGWVSSLEDFCPDKERTLNDAFIGSCVLYPTEAHTIGRVLLSPKYLIGKISCYVRLTDYSFTVFGIRLNTRAFLFQMQDRETTRCAEVTLLNLLDYYGNTYSDYRTWRPNEIIQLERDFSPDRTLPARGINYYTMSRLLTKCGFSPRLYGAEAMNCMSGKGDDGIHHVLHYYIESGIPVAVNISHPTNRALPGHSLVCIGYSSSMHSPRDSSTLCDGSSDLKLIDAADCFSDYVVIDDNQRPYSIRPFDKLSASHEDFKVSFVLVPLYKRMFLEASEAYCLATTVLKDSAYGLLNRFPAFDRSKAVVVRLFLASGRTFKRFRLSYSADQGEGESFYRKLYASVPFPRFVWVAELYLESEFAPGDKQAFGEIVMDATSTTKNDVKSIIMLNYPNSVSIRTPDDTIAALNRRVFVGKEPLILHPFHGFTANLEEVVG